MTNHSHHIKSLISEGKTDEAFVKLLALTEEKDEHFLDDVILLRGIWKDFKRREALNKMTYDEFAVKKTQISEGILLLLQGKDISSIKELAISGSHTQSRKKRVLIIFALIIGSIVVGVFTANWGGINKGYNQGIIGNNNQGNTINIDTTPKPKSQIGIDISGYIETNFEVHIGDSIVIRASGSMTIGRYVGQSTPKGKNSGLLNFPLTDYNLVKEFPHAALMYRINKDMDWKLCGNGVEFIAPKSGELEFQVNDNKQDDNSGAYQVEVVLY